VTRLLIAPALLLLVLGSAACDRSAFSDDARAELSARSRDLTERLSAARSGRDSTAWDKPVAKWELPSMLSEASGLALTSDDRLFTHGDETGDVYELDYRRGVVVKRFQLGPEPVTDDFEAIVVRDSMLMLMTAKGRFYEFREGDNAERVPYRTWDVQLDDACRDFEGAYYDSTTSETVMACKVARGKNAGLLIYRVSLADGASGYSRIDIPADTIRARMPDWKEFSASDITLRRDNGNWLLVAGPENGYLEMVPDGRVVRMRSLPRGHPQAEGLAMTRDGLLLVADEAARSRATLTVYPGPLR